MRNLRPLDPGQARQSKCERIPQLLPLGYFVRASASIIAGMRNWTSFLSFIEQ
jgi:hypothetical protein